MTQSELEALPISPGLCEFGQREMAIDGMRVVVPVAPRVRAMFDPVEVIDIHGVRWMVGWIDGVRYRSRAWGHQGDAFAEMME